MYRVIVADGVELFRVGMITFLQQAGGDYPVISEASDWLRLMAAIAAGPASLVLASVSLIPDMALLMARARMARSRILLVAEDSDSLNCYRTTGAAGVLHRSASESNFLEAVRQIRMGADFVLPTDGARRLELCACLPESLTPGELKILSLLLEGFKNRRIAEYLDVAEHVVRGRLQKIFDKTGFSSRLELALFLSTCR
jgi:DNA-binding NarL/FixJ family response regulator